MFELKWNEIGPGSFYYNHGNFIFKKKKMTGYYVYHIWEGEYLRFNTVNHFEFLRKAKAVLLTGSMPA